MDSDTKLPFLIYGAGMNFSEFDLSNSDFDYINKASATERITSDCDAILTPSVKFSYNSFYDIDNNIIFKNYKSIIQAFKSYAMDKLVGGCISSIDIDGEEEINFSSLISLYKKLAELLDPFVDFFIGYNLKKISDLRAIILACKKFKKPVFVTVDLTQDETSAEVINPLSAMIISQSMGADAFGLSGEFDFDLFKNNFIECKGYSKIPILIYPEFNQNYNSDFIENNLHFLIKNGADLIGINKICNLNIPALIQEKSQYESLVHHDDVIISAYQNNVFFLTPDWIEISPLIKVGYDMSDELLKYSSDDSGYDIINVFIDNVDDAVSFSENQHMSDLPIMFTSSDEVALKTALLLYQGTAFVDSSMNIDESILKKAAKKYGSIIY
ncbi:MAG: hypothetical protein GX346_02640 [Clostridiales bacterium]|nr:hypothetical protein [Clostridiales bacterium]